MSLFEDAATTHLIPRPVRNGASPYPVGPGLIDHRPGRACSRARTVSLSGTSRALLSSPVLSSSAHTTTEQKASEVDHQVRSSGKSGNCGADDAGSQRSPRRCARATRRWSAPRSAPSPPSSAPKPHRSQAARAPLVRRRHADEGVPGGVMVQSQTACPADHRPSFRRPGGS